MKITKNLELNQILNSKKLLSVFTLFLIVSTTFELKAQQYNTKVEFSTYYGNIGTEDADVVAVDPFGNMYLGSHTTSDDLPGVDKHPYKIVGGMDAFIIKLRQKSGEVDYIYHKGGKDWEAIQGIVSDSMGNVYAIGTTYSSDFPISKDGVQNKFGGKSDAFVLKLNPDGKELWSTFLGGIDDEDGRSIIIGRNGNIHIVGRTASHDFIVTDKAIQSKSAGGIDAFVATLNPNGKLLMSTYLGGKGDDIGFSIDQDDTSQLYIAGTTNSTDFPTKNAFQENNNGGDDAFFAVIEPTESDIKLASYLGGKKNERLYNINFNSSGDIFMSGFTYSLDFPTTKDAFQSDLKGGRDIFITRFSLKNKELSYSTYLGGENEDSPRNLAISKEGMAYIIGFTNSKGFPTTNEKGTNLSEEKDNAFLSIIDQSGMLRLSNLYGGKGDDFFEGIALGQDGSIIVSGGSNSVDYPFINPIQDKFLGGRFDIIVTRFKLIREK